MTRGTPGIRFPDGDDWGAVSRVEARRLALGGYGIEIETRLMFLAMSKSSRIGHATFRPGEIRQLLVRPDGDGVLKPLGDRAFGDALNRAIDKGLIESQKSRRCLILPAQLWQQSRHGSWTCDYCGIGHNYRRYDRLGAERNANWEVSPPDSGEFMQANFRDEEVPLLSASL